MSVGDTSRDVARGAGSNVLQTAGESTGNDMMSLNDLNALSLASMPRAQYFTSPDATSATAGGASFASSMPDLSVASLALPSPTAAPHDVATLPEPSPVATVYRRMKLTKEEALRRANAARAKRGAPPFNVFRDGSNNKMSSPAVTVAAPTRDGKPPLARSPSSSLSSIPPTRRREGLVARMHQAVSNGEDHEDREFVGIRNTRVRKRWSAAVRFRSTSFPPVP
eukprot:CAMPEP_0174833128 /NCGR_PEP_ID=MMETSP1114-20130205/4050_1 /TAXON_ID=312471 /ORGANISM="Neobodo designis, Strain CCAP 1951/1" /LENGTH=223 /DNA_ID=CAMNT_0016066999 /DNA_START=46 /DNA_END=717 /DNA_ORIENTATION=+